MLFTPCDFIFFIFPGIYQCYKEGSYDQANITHIKLVFTIERNIPGKEKLTNRSFVKIL